MTSPDIYGSIEHEGIVRSSGKDSVIVGITSESACSGCHAQGSCQLSGIKEKIIEVEGSYDLMPGDNVTILMKKSMGYKALLLGYIFPLIFFILIFILFMSVPLSELVAGLGSIAMLGIYYLILYFFRNSISNKFSFTIKTP